MTSPSKLGNILSKIDKVTGGINPKAWMLKFLPLCIIQACTVFSYTLLKNSKNSVVTRVSPTTTFNWLKILIIMPMALLFPFALAKVKTILKDENRSKIPYVFMFIFLGLYLTFALFLFPFSEYLQFPWLVDVLPNFKLLGAKIFGFVPPTILNGISHTLGYWCNSLFYGSAELWAVVGINFLGWGIANEVCDEKERKIFYPAFGILSNIAGYNAAKIMLGSKLSGLKGAQYIGTIRNILIIVASAILVMILAYFFIEKVVMKNKEMMPERKAKDKKAKPNSDNALKMVISNPFLQKVAIMVVSYSLIIYLVEQCWYDGIVRVYGSAGYTPVVSKVAEINALMTIFMSILSTFFLSNFSWAVVSMIPVAMVGLSAIGFFVFYLLGRSPEAINFLSSSGLMTVMPMQLAVIIGSFQNISSRCSKYSIYDSKYNEAIGAHPDEQVRLEGKGAVDVAFGRISKSSGAFIVLGFLSLHSIWVGFTHHNNQAKAQTTVSRSIDVEANTQVGAVASEELARSIINVDKNENGEYRIVTNDPRLVDHHAFDKTIDNNGNVTFTQKSIDSPSVVQTSETNIVDTKKPSEIPDIAPLMFALVLVMVILWAYAIITLAPIHEENLLTSSKKEGESDSDSEAEASPKKGKKPVHINPFTPKTILQIIVLSSLICGSLYFWVSSAVGEVVKDLKVNTSGETDTAWLREKMISGD